MTLASDSPLPRFMPWLMGPPASSSGIAHYGRVDVVAAQWHVQHDLLAALMPPCYVPLAMGPRQAGLLTVAFADNQGVEFLAGRGYRVASVLVRAAYAGDGATNGDYVVAMFEDDCMPIIFGRELLGLPKLFADISIEDRPDTSMACEASLWGHTLFALETGPLEPREVMPEEAAAMPPPQSLLGWRVFPGLARGEPILTPVTATIEELAQGGQATLRWGLAGPGEVGCVSGLIDTLRTIAVDEPVAVARSVMSRALRTDRLRRLDVE